MTNDHAPFVENVFDLEVEEGAYAVDGIEGEVPGWLRGSYYLNGPALFGRAGRRYRHWLDGDGLVTALHFRAEGVQAVHRYVRSTKFVDETLEGKLLYRAFGTAFEGDRLKRGIGLESPANVSAYRFGDVLLAFGEQGLPWELDPITLETHGEHTFGGRLNAISPLSAHPCFDPESGEMVNFGISFAAHQPSLTLYRFRHDGELLMRRRLPIDYPCSVHDFGLSPNHAIFYLSPYLLDVERLIREGATLMEALVWEPERGSQLVIAARETGEKQATISLEGKYCLHLINSFEEDGKLIVDVVELDRPVYDQYEVVPDLFTEVEPGRPCAS
ncbi:MAG: carotenoid oxygenase family protein [Thermoanaerobaculia bacterium]|nr:carotenoid oxygenase family protein [Thermoanaerobaculia bacterium]